MALLVIGVDRFKDVNSAFDHAVGDSVLRQLSERLLVSAGAGVVARLAGDTFAVFQPTASVDPGSLARLVEGAGWAFMEPFLGGGSTPVRLSATVGVAWSRVGPGAAASLLRNAEIAMFRAKAERLPWTSYDPALDERSADRLTRIGELREAIAERQLVVYYQPIIDLITGRPVSVEALVRWHHPERGVIPPGDFIRLAEESGLIAALTELVVSMVIEQIRTCTTLGHELTCAINVSSRCLTDPACSRRLLDALAPVATAVTVEVTESVMADARAVATLEQFAAAGISSAIDDFGTGYSSLATLKTLPTTTLKIDRALIRDIERDPRDVELARGAVWLARSFGLNVIAEGIETEGAAARLREVGVAQGQGFWFAQPMPAADLAAWLDRSTDAFASEAGGASASGSARLGEEPSDHE